MRRLRIPWTVSHLSLVALLAATGVVTSDQSAGAGTCVPGELRPGPVTRLSPPGRYVSAPALVSDVSGRLSTAFQVQTHAGQPSLWSSEVPQSQDDPQLLRAGDFAHWPVPGAPEDFGVDATGIQTFVWREEVARGWQVSVAAGAPGAEWSAPTKLDEVARYIAHVHLAVNASGAAVVTWSRSTNTFAAYRPSADAAWSPLQRLARDGGYDSDVGIDDAGNALVLFQESGSGRGMTRRLDPVTGWGPARRVAGGGVVGGGTRLAVSPNGTAVVTWRALSRGPNGVIFSRRMTPEGVWQATVRHRWFAGPTYAAPAIDGRGVVVIAWWNRNHEVVAQFGRPDGSWRVPIVLTRRQPNPGHYGLDVAMNRRGDALVVWHAWLGHDPRLRGRYRPFGGPWAPPLRLTPPRNHPDSYTSVVAPNGDAGVAWMRATRRRDDARQLTFCP